MTYSLAECHMLLLSADDDGDSKSSIPHSIGRRRSLVFFGHSISSGFDVLSHTDCDRDYLGDIRDETLPGIQSKRRLICLASLGSRQYIDVPGLYTLV